jgi:hypothetical protein
MVQELLLQELLLSQQLPLNNVTNSNNKMLGVSSLLFLTNNQHGPARASNRQPQDKDNE